MHVLLQPAERKRYKEQFAEIRGMSQPIPRSKRHEASIEDVGIGGYIGFEGNSYSVKGMNVYERHGVRWPELSLYRLNDGKTQYLEWEKEDEVSVYVSRENLSFEQVGLRGKEQLWEIAEAETGEVQYNGTRFRYHEDSEVTFFRDGGSKGEGFHQYLFASPDRRTFICVEEWGDADVNYDHNVILSSYLDPKAIEVIVRKGPE